LFEIGVKRSAQAAAFGGIVALLSACGSSANTDASPIVNLRQAPRHSVQRCLERHGAVRARTVDDLAVLVKAEEEDDVSKPGFAYDKVASIVVDVWTGGSVENRPAPWMMWIGHPFGRRFTPEEIVVEKPPKSYVMYVTTAKKRRSVESCVVFSEEGKQPPAEINLSH
jgi:hypothetical protein